jgi:hypothetical protein
VQEGTTQFGMWAMLAAPLIMGNDLRNVPAAAKAVLLNEEIIAIDQDALGQMGLRMVLAIRQGLVLEDVIGFHDCFGLHARMLSDSIPHLLGLEASTRVIPKHDLPLRRPLFLPFGTVNHLVVTPKV